MDENEFFDALRASSFDLEKVSALLDENPGLVNSTHPGGGYGAMHAIAKSGSIGLMRKAIDFGGDIHVKDDEGMAPIWWAVDAEAFEVADLLLKLGVSINEPKDNGFYIIHEETLYGDHAEMEYVLSKGLSVNQRTSDLRGHTPLHIGAMVSSTTIELLLSNGADIEAKDSSGKTPLFYALDANVAVIGSKLECIRCLLDNGADIYVKSNDGESLWDIARRNSTDEFVKLLDGHVDEN